MSGLALRTRFSLAMGLLVMLGLAAVGISASALFQRHVERVFHAELEEHLVELAGLTALDADGQPRLMRPLSDPRFGAERSGYYWQVRRNRDQPLRSPSLAAARLDDRLAHSEGITHILAPGPAGPAMIYGMTRPVAGGMGGTLHYLVATDRRHLDGLVADFRRDLLLWLGALAVLLLGGAALALRFATRPLDRLGAAIAAVKTGGAQRLGGPWPAEIAPLAADLDRLFDDREAMVAAARIEAGNLAHGLRTSLAVLSDEAESLADQPAGATLLGECRRMVRQLDWHLARARLATQRTVMRGAAGGAVTMTEAAARTRLPEALTPLITAMARLHQGRGIDFSAHGPAAVAAVDPEAFAEIVSNLLDNGGKWAARAVRVMWAREGDRLVLRVVDDGPGVSAAAAARLFVPGVRLDEQVPGHGLGLAIARDLAEAAGGTLALGAREDGGRGAEARLVLPAA
ncbi:MAG: sensor histidine kinase [Polymorphobacter sp.]|uniref:sensor histidine kinase n=1 Tax=Polymorphobacter sp. TaxID=1909290 RepID=UPI003A86ACA0